MQYTDIEWCKLSWNPITGCTRNCPGCYAARQIHRSKHLPGYDKDEPFRPTLHPKRLDQPRRRKIATRIFTVSMGDMFDPQVKPEWINAIFDVMQDCPQHTFQVLTKQPRIVKKYEKIIPENMWIGISQDGSHTPNLIPHLQALDVPNTKFISFEPLLGPIEPDLTDIDWVIIGALTKSGGGYKLPKNEWVENILTPARNKDIPIFIKDNLRWAETIREYPASRTL